MKNRLLIVLSLITVTAAYAQDSDASGSSSFKFGIRVGGVVSKFNRAQPHISERFGMMAGLVAELPVSAEFAVQGELSYLQQGGTYTRFVDNTRFGDIPSMTSFYVTTSKITAQYVDLAVTFKYRPGAWGNFQPNIVVGPAVGYNIGIISKYDKTFYYNQTFYSAHGTDNLTSEYQYFQMGALAGVGGEISLGKQRLMLDLRYRYGVTPAKKSYSYIDLNAVQGDLYNNSFYITLGLGF